MSENTAIFVSPCNLSEQLHSDVTAALELLSQEGHIFKVNDKCNNSHLLVIDVDDEVGRQQLNQSLSGQVKLLISTNVESGKNIISLQKPVDVEKIKNVLCKLFNMMQAHLLKINTKKKASETTGLITDSIFYHLLKAKKDKKTLHIISKDFEVFVDGNNQSLKSKGSLDDIRRLINLPYSHLFINTINEKVFHEKSKDLQVVTLHNVLWTAAIICSKGNLLPDQDKNKPVKLRAWPSFTRNDFKPDHLKLAALLAQRPVSLSDLEKQTNIPYSDIVDFYNAAFAVDLIDQNISVEPETAQPLRSSPGKKKSTLLNKIAARLGLNQSAYGTYHG